MKIKEIISEQIDFYLSILRNKIIFEQELPNVFSNQNKENQTTGENNPVNNLGDPNSGLPNETENNLNNLGDPNSGLPNETENEKSDDDTDIDSANTEEELIDKSFEKLKSIAKKTEDIAEIISAIKGMAQDIFSTPDAPDATKPDINLLFKKIMDDKKPSSNLLKRALKRQELKFLKK
jgi:hypothetical protein